VVFNPLDTETLTGIAGLMLGELKDALKDKLIDFKYDKKLCEYLALKCDSAKRGARDLRNLIRRELENKIVDIIVDKGEGAVSKITATAKEEISLKTE
jgi:ATP-dependent Clp protease ATP-binding subunit ClpA